MLNSDKDALYCDLAETYGLYDWGSLSVFQLASLSCGLRDDSRIKMRLRGDKIPYDQFLLAYIADRMTQILWVLSANDSSDKPYSLLSELYADKIEKNGFESFEAFEEARMEFMR